MRHHLLLVAALVQGCAPAAVEGASDGGPNPAVGGAGDDGDDSVGDTLLWQADTGVEAVAGRAPEAEACSDLYDPDTLQQYALDFEPEAWSALESACASSALTYVPATFSMGDEVVAAHVRLKGNWSWRCDKMQFMISFNEDDPDGRFHGQRKIVLDAPWYDHTLLHERLAFPVFERRGLPHSCVNNARLDVNGAYYGLYANVERIDREYLERNFDEPDGNLYQAGVELKTNEDEADTSRQQALAAATTLDQIAALVDLDQAVAEWATEAWVPAMDNYWAGVEINYYLYDHPSRGFVYLPYDLDISFGDPAYPDGTLLWPDTVTADPIHHEHPGWRKEQLVETVLADPFWCGRFVEELAATQATTSTDAMVASVRAWDDQIRPSVVEDPNRPFSVERHDAAIDALVAFVPARAAFVQAWLDEGGHCPEG